MAQRPRQAPISWLRRPNCRDPPGRHNGALAQSKRQLLEQPQAVADFLKAVAQQVIALSELALASSSLLSS